MVYPKKHLPIEKTLIYFGYEIIELLNEPKKLDDLWYDYKSKYKNSKQTYSNMILALDFLFAIDRIIFAIDGKIDIKR